MPGRDDAIIDANDDDYSILVLVVDSLLPPPLCPPPEEEAAATLRFASLTRLVRSEIVATFIEEGSARTTDDKRMSLSAASSGQNRPKNGSNDALVRRHAAWEEAATEEWRGEESEH